MRSKLPPVTKKGNVVTLSPALSAHVDRIAKYKHLDPGTIVETIFVKAAMQHIGPGEDETVSLTVKRGTALAQMVAFIKSLEPHLSTAEILAGWIERDAVEASDEPELIMLLRYAATEFQPGRKGGRK